VHSDPEAEKEMPCLPESLRGRVYYEPEESGDNKYLYERFQAFIPEEYIQVSPNQETESTTRNNESSVEQ